MVSNSDVRQSDSLGQRAALADSRDVQLRRLASILELRVGIPGQYAESHQQSPSTLPYVTHNHTLSSPQKTTIQMSFFSVTNHPTGDRRPLRQGVSRNPGHGTGELGNFRIKCFSSVGPVAQRLEQRTHNLLGDHVHPVVSIVYSGDSRGFSGIFGTETAVLGPNWDRVLGPAIHCGRASSFVRCSSSTLFANSRIPQLVSSFLESSSRI